MRRFVIAFLTFLSVAGVSPSWADDIAVYRGTLRFATDAQTAALIPPTLKSYWIINYTTGKVANIIYFNRNGKKQTLSTANWSLAEVLLPQSKTGTLLVLPSATQTSLTEFSFSTLFLRGTNTVLPIETAPEKRTVLRPRVLKGDFITASANNSNAGFQDATIALTLDNAKTLAANNEDKTVETVSTEIRLLLESQGFQSL